MRLCNERRERVYFIMARVRRRVPLTPSVYNDRREKAGDVCLYAILHVVKSLPALWPERMFQRARANSRGFDLRVAGEIFSRVVRYIDYPNHGPSNLVTTLVVVTETAVFDTTPKAVSARIIVIVVFGT